MSLYIESAVNGLRSFLVNWSSSSSWSTSLANTLLTRNELTLRDVPQEFIVGDEFQVNSYTTSDQSYSAVAALSDGSLVVTWSSTGQDGDQAGAYGQLIDVSGGLKGNEFQINTYTTSYQSMPAPAGLSGEGFVVAWHSNGQDGSGNGIYARRYNQNAAPQGIEFLVNAYTTDSQVYPSMVGVINGGFVVAWASNLQDGSLYGTYALRYDNLGNPLAAGFKVNTFTTNNQFYPSIAGLRDGGFVIVMNAQGTGDTSGIYGQRYNNAGVAQGSEFRVNTATVDTQSYPAAAGLGSGGFVVVWQSNLQDGSGYGIYGQLYDSAGGAVASEFQINTFTTSDQTDAAVVALADGGFVVAWQSNGQDGSGYGIYGQRYTGSGALVGSEFQINQYTTGEQFFVYTAGYNSGGSFLAPVKNGGFIATWTSTGQDGDSDGVYARMYTFPALPPSGNTPFPLKLALGLGGAAILGSGIGYGLYKKRVESRIKLRKQDSELSSESFNDQTMYSGATQVSEVVRVKNESDIEHVLSMSPSDPRFLNDEKHQVVGENSFFKPAPETQEKKKRKLSKEAKTLSMVGVGRPGSSF